MAIGKKKMKPTMPTIPDLSSESSRFIDEVQEQPDHIAAMLAVQFLSDILEALLRSFFVDHSEVVNKLFTDNGALDGLASRIDTAYALGLIGPELHHDLHTIRKIRNSFAHTYWQKKFTDAETSEDCQKLKTSRKLMYPNGLPWDDRSHFLTSSIMIGQHLLVNGLSQRHRTVGRDFEISPLV